MIKPPDLQYGPERKEKHENGMRREKIKPKIKKFLIEYFHCIAWAAVGIFILLMGRITRFQYFVTWAALMIVMWRYMPNKQEFRENDFKEETRKLKICYLSDLPIRLENSRRILLYLAEHIESVWENGFSTEDAEYVFINCDKPENTIGILADQVIIDYREPMCTIAENILQESCVPDNYQIIDDRKIGTSDFEMY